MTPTRLPTPFVKVPRAVAADYWHRPWTDVLAAAERGEDGCSVQAPNNDQDYAFLREGDDVWTRGKTLLFQQNW